MRYHLSLLSLLSLVAINSANAAEPPSYAKQIKPFIGKYCLECHNGEDAKKGLNLETYKGLQEGGNSGPVVVPGKPDESRLVLQVEGKAKPPMPPKTARQPKANELSLLRAWVAAGARDDSATVAATIPNIKPRSLSAPPVTALAYRPDGKVLAAGGHHEVILIDVTTGDVIGKLPGQAAKVTALAFRRDGQYLAVASGSPSTAGEVRLYAVPANGLPNAKPDLVIQAHKDIIYDIVYSPDGKILATTGYDRLIKLWESGTGKELRTLKDHSDAVYGLAFSPDGKLLASAAADRAVKVWDVSSGKRLYTLGDATDWLYAVAWSPDGRRLAAAGVDKSIRVWEPNTAGGRLIHSVFAHEASVIRLVYSSDGKTLYSLSEDRSVKSWDAARMVERRVYAKQPEAVLALAVRPDHKQLALGRYDGSAILLDEASGKVQAEPLPAKPKPPQVSKVTPASGQRGQTIRLTFEGKHLDQVTELVSPAGANAKLLADTITATSVSAEITFPTTTPAGVYQLSLKAAAGPSNAQPFILDLFPHVPEKEQNDSPGAGQVLSLPATAAGAIGKAGDVDFYRFEAQAGQEIGVQVVNAPGSKLEPILELTDATGRVLTESSSGVLGHVCDKAGTYAVAIRDRDYRGDSATGYRLQVGDVPVITAVYPLGLQRGTEAAILVQGVNLGTRAPQDRWVKLKAPLDAAIGSKLPVQLTTPNGPALGNRSVVVGEFPEAGKVDELERPANSDGVRGITPVPGTANGWLLVPGLRDTWRFRAKKGERLILEVNARRLGSPLDSYIEILDAKEQPVPRATLRSQAKTYVTFRDHDSAQPNIRIEAWGELGVNDYIYVGSELLRIKSLPTHPDADCFFFSTGGQRTGYLDTTPTHHAMNEPMYKVEIHPPGATFPPNGFPVFTISYRNDDGGSGYGKDSRLYFDPPADGEYLVRIGDSREVGMQPGADTAPLRDPYPYRLTIRPPRPSFNVSFNPTAPALPRGGGIPITVNADRSDGFEGTIHMRLENLPPGISAPATTIPAGENTTAFSLYAEANASIPANAPPIKLVTRAAINGQEVVREVAGGQLKLEEPGEIVTTTEQSEVTLQPGGEVRVTAKIERRNGFAGRVPLDVKGLPHGVRVLDIGLNGILITEKETSRTFVIYAEPWVEPIDHPIVVLAKREGKNTEHAAKSVLLKVAAPK